MYKRQLQCPAVCFSTGVSAKAARPDKTFYGWLLLAGVIGIYSDDRSLLCPGEACVKQSNAVLYGPPLPAAVKPPQHENYPKSFKNVQTAKVELRLKNSFVLVAASF